MSHKSRVLEIVKTDIMFNIETHRNKQCWRGTCLYCRTALIVELDGTTLATIEHVIPTTLGGTDEPQNLALACFSCNAEKGRRQDKKLSQERIEKYTLMRKRRWRDHP